MTSHVVVDVFKTWLRWKEGRRDVLTGDEASPVLIGDPPALGGRAGQWSPEALLVGAVESGTHLSFLELASARGFQPVGYESSAVGRIAREPGSGAHFTDLIVYPRVLVRTPAEAEIARQLFEDLPRRCTIARTLRSPLRIVPLIEILPAQAGGPPHGWPSSFAS